MYQLIVSYAHPEDPDAFLEHYRTVHAPLAARFPGLRSYTWTVCELPDGSAPPHFAVAVLTWDDKADAMAAMGSEIGRESRADLRTFAGAGVQTEFGEVVTVM